jgi:hypothetical protein
MPLTTAGAPVPCGDIASELALAVNCHRLGLAARVVDDLELARPDDEELEIAVAHREPGQPVPVGPEYGSRSPVKSVNLVCVEHREGDGLEIFTGHGLSSPSGGQGKGASGDSKLNQKRATRVNSS